MTIRPTCIVSVHGTATEISRAKSFTVQQEGLLSVSWTSISSQLNMETPMALSLDSLAVFPESPISAQIDRYSVCRVHRLTVFTSGPVVGVISVRVTPQH